MIQFPAKEVHEIELSSRCNLACIYCPHPQLQRSKEDITWDTYQQALDHVRYFVQQGTQTEVSLTGIGEAILHPDFVPMTAALRQVLGPRRKIVLSTNGVAMTDALAREIVALQVQVYVSLHRPEVAGPAIEMLRRAGCVSATTDKFVTMASNWAGQVDWYVSSERYYCGYLTRKWVVVRASGAIDQCCWDAHDKHPIGHVSDAPGSLMVHAIGLCATCHQKHPPEFAQQQQTEEA